MRKELIILSVCAIALSSCAKERNGVNNGSEGPMPILFNTSMNSYKTLIDNDEQMQANPISLYGWTFIDQENPDVPTFVMNDFMLRYNGASWEYSPRQYWLDKSLKYGFAGLWPAKVARNDRDFLPTELDLTTTPISTPFDDSFISDDVVRNVICSVSPQNAYFTNVIPERLAGYKEVPASDFGKTVTLPMEHVVSAFRFRVRNLTDNNICLHDWYMTGLETHCDMSALIIGGKADGSISQILHRIEDSRFVDIKHAPVEVVNTKDTILIKDINPDGTLSAPTWKGCVDPKPGDENYKYIVISQKLPEQVTPEQYAADPNLTEIKAKYAAVYPNYSTQIYWGEAKNMHVSNCYVPLCYERGSVLPDYDGSGVRGDKGDYDANVRVYECRSHMVKCNATTGEPTTATTGVRYYPNGGIYMPVSATNEANLYSPYFVSSESHTTPIEDWKEYHGPIADRTPSHLNDDGSYSIFLWTALNNKADRWNSTNVEEAIGHYNARDGVFTTSVQGGDLATALNPDGYVAIFPQTLDHLVLHLNTAAQEGITDASDYTTAYFGSPVHRTVDIKSFTPGGEWKSGYKYDYLITITTDKILITLDVEPWKERTSILE